MVVKTVKQPARMRRVLSLTTRAGRETASVEGDAEIRN